jgi:alginate O-acetyltransferase complex protein AlgI
MIFSSISFLFYFLPVFLVAYFLAPTNLLKNLVALVFSLVFYGWGEPWFVLVLVGSIIFNTVMGLLIDRLGGWARRVALVAAVTANLLLLGVFKYTNFVMGNLNTVLQPLGFGAFSPNIPLPLGISFFTFHCLSYVIDIYRGRFRANRNLIEVALYIALFPQLVAGPIVRYSTIAHQLRHRTHRLLYASSGAQIFIIGLAQKVLIADQVAPLAQVAFDQTPAPSMVESWSGLLAYTVQIYFDFAGYSNMAVGLGLILGFSFPRNFRLPYTARSVTEFWRLWHMSLSAWLRDYLYIPLGGSRSGVIQTYRNLFTVFLLCGLWHGASWNFVLWGTWHGTFLVIERLGLGNLLRRLPAPVQWAYTLLAVMGGWVLFRAADISSARVFFGGLAGQNGLNSESFDFHVTLNPGVIAPLVAGCLLAVLPRWIRLPAFPSGLAAPVDAAWIFTLLIVAMTFVAAGTYSPFLYFRF